MGIFVWIIMFFVVVYVLPVVVLFGVTILVYHRFGTKALLSFLLIIALVITAFLAYFRFGIDDGIVARAIAKRDPSVCSRLLRWPEVLAGFSGPVIAPRYACYKAYVQALRSVEECDRIPAWHECIETVAIETKDLSACDNYPESYDVQSCYSNVGWQDGGAANCEVFDEFYRFRNCRDMLGDHTGLDGKGDTMCPPITDKGTREECYFWFGIHAQETHLCELLSNDSDHAKELRRQCLREATR